jgi:hypothetical protein
MWLTDGCRRDHVDYAHVPTSSAVGLMQVTRIPAAASPIACLLDVAKPPFFRALVTHAAPFAVREPACPPSESPVVGWLATSESPAASDAL